MMGGRKEQVSRLLGSSYNILMIPTVVGGQDYGPIESR